MQANVAGPNAALPDVMVLTGNLTRDNALFGVRLSRVNSFNMRREVWLYGENGSACVV